MSGNHQKFLSHLEESVDGVWVVARMLQRRGYTVTVPAISKARAHSEWKEHADDGDLLVQQRVEVKNLGINFTGREDWPFGEKFIVCAKHSFDNAVPKPWAYVILSASRENAAVVMGTTHHHWYVESRIDRRYENVEQEFYFCPLGKVVFFNVPTVAS